MLIVFCSWKRLSQRVCNIQICMYFYKLLCLPLWLDRGWNWSISWCAWFSCEIWIPSPRQLLKYCNKRFSLDSMHLVLHYKKNTLPWWYVFVTVGRFFFHACTSMTNLWQNQDSHTCDVVEVFHDITKIIITEVSTSMTINRASQKCFRQGWPTRGIHRNGTPLSYRVGFWIR